MDEEVSWAIRHHQVLRFFADESYGYKYPDSYIRLFGGLHARAAHPGSLPGAREHKWYETCRLITVNDLYAFDPNVKVELEEFTDVIGRHFKQPKEGLGFDQSPSAHMWRTMNHPTKYL